MSFCLPSLSLYLFTPFVKRRFSCRFFGPPLRARMLVYPLVLFSTDESLSPFFLLFLFLILTPSLRVPSLSYLKLAAALDRAFLKNETGLALLDFHECSARYARNLQKLHSRERARYRYTCMYIREMKRLER